MSRWRNIAARTAIDLDWKGADRLLKQVLQILPREAAQALDGLNAAQVEEIRLRCGQVPSVLRQGTEQPLPHCERTPQQELQRTLLAASAQSQYAVQEQLREGFLSVPGGVRIGVCGSAVVQDGRVTGLLDATKTHYAGDKFTTGNNWGVNVLGAVSENVGEEDTIVLTYARDIVLEQAREKVAAYRTELRNKMETTIAENSMGIMGSLINLSIEQFKALHPNEPYPLPAPPNEFNDSVKNYVAAMETVAADAVNALRWALLANAAADEKNFPSADETKMQELGKIYAKSMDMPLTGEDSIVSNATAYGYQELASAAEAMAAAVTRINTAGTLVKDGQVGNAGLQLVSWKQTFMYGSKAGDASGGVKLATSAVSYDLTFNPTRGTPDNPAGLVTEDTIFTVAHTDADETNLFSAIAMVI